MMGRALRNLVVRFSIAASCRQRGKAAVRVVLQQISTDDSEAALRQYN